MTKYFVGVLVLGLLNAQVVLADDSSSRLPAAEAVKITNTIDQLNADPFRPDIHQARTERSASSIAIEKERRRRFVEDVLRGTANGDTVSPSGDGKSKANSSSEK